MIDEEALVLITRAALIDPRLKRTDDVERADMAEAWAAVLDDVTLTDALVALRSLQRARGASEPAIQPADVLAAVGVIDPDPQVEDVTPKYLEVAKARDLARIGVTAHDYDTNPTIRAAADRKLDALALERLVSE